MTRKPIEKTWRLASLTVLSSLVLAACGGGGDGSSSPSPPPAQACTPTSASAAPASAPSGPQGTRLIARLSPTAVAAPSASAAKSAAPSVPGLRMLNVTKFDTPSAAKATGASGGAAATDQPLQFATYEVTEPGMDAHSAMQRLRDSGTVEYVELDTQQRKYRLPNDPLFPRAWHLKNTGQFQSYVVGNDIRAESAWNVATGTGQTVVAVVDDGVTFDHPDLAANMWRNPREVPNNNLDDDGNGIVDDVHGADMVLGTGDVFPYFPRIDSDHGTMVAGVIAARGNNNEGSSGVLWNTQLMALKIEGPESSNYSLFVSDFVKALGYVVAQKRAGVNVRVINISYGGVSDTQSYRDALVAAGNAGILVVVAAGNDGSSSLDCLGYPSAWQLPNVLSVGSLTPANTRAASSNFGSLVNIFAPGENILTTSMFASGPAELDLIQPGYRWISGTSFAAPVVAGAAALMMDAYPSSSFSAVRNRLLATAVPFGTPLPGTTQTKLNLGTAIAAPP